MASISTNKVYMTTGSTFLYEIDTSNNIKTVATIKQAGEQVTFTSTRTVNGTLYAQIGGQSCPSCTIIATNKAGSSSGYYVDSSKVEAVSSSDSETSDSALGATIAKTYQTTILATVYRRTNDLMTPVGSIPKGTKVTFSALFDSGSGIYGMVGGSSCPSYTDYSTGALNASAGMYLLLSQVTSVETNGTTTVNTTTSTNNDIILSNVNMLPDPLYYTVRTGYTWTTYKGPAVNEYNSMKSYVAGQEICIYATYKDADGITWGSSSSALDSWGVITTASGATTTALQVSSINTNQNPAPTTPAAAQYTTVNTNSYGTPTDASADTYAMQSAVAKDWEVSDSYSPEALEGIANMQYVIGIPPKITRTADIPYMEDYSPSNNFGRCYTEMFMMGNTVFSIQPCKVKYLPNFTDDEKNFFWNTVAASLGVGDDSEAETEISGQLFEGLPDYNEYINTVNLLARVMAIFLGIGEKTYMNTTTKYKDMDYSWYKTRGDKTHGATGFMGVVETAIRAVSDAVGSVINDDTYIHFYMTADGTSLSENLSVSTRSSSLESLFNNQLSELAQEIQFLGGAESGINFESAIDDAKNNLSGVADGISQTLGNIVRYGGNYLKGGRLVFPQMVDDCTYDRSYRGTCRFISPSGDIEAIFLNCYLPLCYILPYVLPQMLSDNMYRYPFLARVDAKGLYHCDLAAITGLQIQRGGQEGNCFTADGLPFEIDVSFDITPLYSKLMVTSARHPILFMSNTALHEYLGAMCGITFAGNQLDLKLEILKTLLGNYLTDTIPSMLRSFYSSGIANWARKLFNFGA